MTNGKPSNDLLLSTTVVVVVGLIGFAAILILSKDTAQGMAYAMSFSAFLASAATMLIAASNRVTSQNTNAIAQNTNEVAHSTRVNVQEAKETLDIVKKQSDGNVDKLVAAATEIATLKAVNVERATVKDAKDAKDAEASGILIRGDK
jgi:hypothetical protein